MSQGSINVEQQIRDEPHLEFRFQPVPQHQFLIPNGRLFAAVDGARAMSETGFPEPPLNDVQLVNELSGEELRREFRNGARGEEWRLRHDGDFWCITTLPDQQQLQLVTLDLALGRVFRFANSLYQSLRPSGVEHVAVEVMVRNAMRRRIRDDGGRIATIPGNDNLVLNEDVSIAQLSEWSAQWVPATRPPSPVVLAFFNGLNPVNE